MTKHWEVLSVNTQVGYQVVTSYLTTTNCKRIFFFLPTYPKETCLYKMTYPSTFCYICWSIMLILILWQEARGVQCFLLLLSHHVWHAYIYSVLHSHNPLIYPYCSRFPSKIVYCHAMAFFLIFYFLREAEKWAILYM